MKKKSFIFLVIILIIIILVLTGILIFLKINSSSEKIFVKTARKTFEKMEEAPIDFSTIKSNMEVFANIETDNDSLNEINNQLEDTKLILSSEIDCKNIYVNQNIKINKENEILLDLNMLLQNNKMYLYAKDYFEKYIEVSYDDYEYKELNESLDKIVSIDKKAVLEEIKIEFIKELSKQSFSQEKTEIDLNSNNTQVSKSSLTFTEEQLTIFIKNILSNLKQNNNFKVALGKAREDTLDLIDKVLEISPSSDNSESRLTISIYTKGLLNEVVRIDGSIDYSDTNSIGVEFVKHNKQKMELSKYEKKDNNKTYLNRIIIEDKKETNQKGKIVITMDNENDIICNYNKDGKKISFEISAEVEGIPVTISGDIIRDNMQNSGNVIFSAEDSEYGKISIYFVYAIKLNENIQKVDVLDSVKIDEITKEEKEEIYEKIQSSRLYELLQSYITNGSTTNNSMLFNNSELINEDNVVTLDNHIVFFNTPNTMKPEYYNPLFDDTNTYTDDELNIVKISIKNENYLTCLQNMNLLLEPNQSITEIGDYELNGKHYKYRGITYNQDENSILKMTFTYELDSMYSYVVEAEIRNNSIGLNEINNFLNIINY